MNRFIIFNIISMFFFSSAAVLLVKAGVPFWTGLIAGWFIVVGVVLVFCGAEERE